MLKASVPYGTKVVACVQVFSTSVVSSCVKKAGVRVGVGGREWHGIPLCVVCDFDSRPLLPQARDQRCCLRGRS